MKSTHIYTEKFDTRRKLANRALKAMNDISDCDNGTIRNPYELASSVLKDGRTLIQTIYEFCMYVDFTAFACKEMGIETYECINEIEEELV